MDQSLLEYEAIRLPGHQRALLADALLASLEDDDLKSRQAAWGEEAEQRLTAYSQGRVGDVDARQVLEELRSRYRK